MKMTNTYYVPLSMKHYNLRIFINTCLEICYKGLGVKTLQMQIFSLKCQTGPESGIRCIFVHSSLDDTVYFRKY